jgi:transposase InsO family protein
MALSRDLNNLIALVTQTLKQAKQKEKVTDELILHSDQGTQYTSHPYHILVGEYNITPSMSRRGNCWDNAPMENFFGHLKKEYLRQFKQTTFKDTEQLIDEYVYFYNYERIQLKTKQTPYETRCLTSGGFLFLSCLLCAVQKSVLFVIFFRIHMRLRNLYPYIIKPHRHLSF